jgi:uncharacterized protein YndB with AHSA1/START domain
MPGFGEGDQVTQLLWAGENGHARNMSALPRGFKAGQRRNRPRAGHRMWHMPWNIGQCANLNERRREKAAMGTHVSRIIKASRQAIYQAFLDPAALVMWLPPAGMTGHVHEFDPRQGGAFRMSLTYLGPDHVTRGKTLEHIDVFRGRFLELIPNQRIVQLIEFESDDPLFAGPMTITWTLVDVPDGTQATVLCENEPAGIRPDDHAAGMRSSLANLAAFTE